MLTLSELNAMQLTKYRIQQFDGELLFVVGDDDLSCHHQVEITFRGVQHIHCDIEFE